MQHRRLPVLLTLLLTLVIAMAGCSDDDDDADPTPPGIGDEDTNATVPRDDDGAIGEPDDEDSQTDTTDVGAPVDEDVPNDDSEGSAAGGPADDVVPVSNRARVVGVFGDQEIDLLLTDGAECAIEQPSDAGDEAGAEVVGATTGGDAFELDWSVDDGALQATLDRDGTNWTAREDLDDDDQDEADRPIRLTRNGEVLMATTFPSDQGETADAQLYVNCEPVTRARTTRRLGR